MKPMTMNIRTVVKCAAGFQILGLFHYLPPTSKWAIQDLACGEDMAAAHNHQHRHLIHQSAPIWLPLPRQRY